MAQGTSLREARAIYEELGKAERKLDELERKAERTAPKLTQIISLAYGMLGIMSRLGLPEDIDRAVGVVMRLISAVNMLRVSLLALEAASGPVGWGLALIGIIGTGLATFQWIDMEARRSRGW